ncbi:HNH endonuclease [Thalassospira xiamenensis]|uniref:Restriction endonuclease n=1 Tax=Thalassospira xiamenensis TaxID=220697 RepID=A0A367XCC6_9PROT|nr:HNH endonuclease [Thalassospira xiamenensis]RCK51318.1 restriction endonuclease [Thalassospira xiamenensis]
MVEETEIVEPAENNHTPPGWPIELIEFEPSGKAPKSPHGNGVYRFSAALTLSVILPRRGWTLIKQTKNYAYLRPPADQPNPPFRISIAVPTRAECVAIAKRSQARGKSWMGQLGEWPVLYIHERNRDMREIWRNRDTGKIETILHPVPLQSSLHIGEWGIWQAEVNDDSGDFVVTRFSPEPCSLVGATDQPTTAPVVDLFEGAERAVVLTTYERNSEARRRCIAHYGATCRACGLDYEKKYGAIGAGLIHVHHITPISRVSQAYQVDPVRDLVPLCATCHHVVHRREPPYTVLEIRRAIAERAACPLSGAREI